MNDAVPDVARRARRLASLAGHDVEELKRVTPRKSTALGGMDIHSVLDLLLHYPRRWVDRRNPTAIAALVEGEEAVVAATVDKVTVKRPRGRAAIVEAIAVDETGELRISFFNQPWRAKTLAAGQHIIAIGKVDTYRGHAQMTNPSVDLVGSQVGRIVAIYPQSAKAGVGSIELSEYVEEALERAGDILDPLTDDELADYGLVGRTEAFRQIHRPEDFELKNAARRRLAFDELFRVQLELVLRKRAATLDARGIQHHIEAEGEHDLVGRFLASLPFALTDPQQRALAEIAADLGAPLPMHRLLQGDVGAGKTVVALAALLYGVQGGHQGALMVPTEVLAEQHFAVASRLLATLTRPDEERLFRERPLTVALLTSTVTASDRSRLLTRLRNGEIDVLVGTHALITDDVRFARLGVVVIDEQHRFGVDQRAALREKGSVEDGAGHDPDLLVMTATPIPRTAAMMVYGDLDQSVLDGLPPGRKPVRTRWVRNLADEPRVWKQVRTEVAKGHQVFVVCPFIRPGEADDVSTEPEDTSLFDDAVAQPIRAATTEFERLRDEELVGLRIGLLHGQLPEREKDRVMDAFRAGEISVLVATTVIEVGVDIPAATVMVIESAERFGIAQLHQLRGRVGRGEAESACYLLGWPTTDIGERRLAALESISDGFELAEVDLELRGEGTVLGARQRGRSDLRLASLKGDRDLIALARRAAEAIVEADPSLEQHPMLLEELEFFIGEEEAAYVVRS